MEPFASRVQRECRSSFYYYFCSTTAYKRNFETSLIYLDSPLKGEKDRRRRVTQEKIDNFSGYKRPTVSRNSFCYFSKFIVLLSAFAVVLHAFNSHDRHWAMLNRSKTDDFFSPNETSRYFV